MPLKRIGRQSGSVNINIPVTVGLVDLPFYDNEKQFPSIIESADIVPIQLTRQFPGEASSIGQIFSSINVDTANAIMDFSNKQDSWTWEPGGNGVDSWISILLPKPRAVGSFLLRSKSDSCPTSIKLEGSNDSEIWTTLFSSDSLGTWDTNYESKVFTIEGTPDEYYYYKLTILDSSASTLRLSLFRLFCSDSECPRDGFVINSSEDAPVSACFLDGGNTVVCSLPESVKLTREDMIAAAINQDTVDFLNGLSMNTVEPMMVFLERNPMTDELSIKVGLHWFSGYGQGIKTNLFPSSGIPFPAGNISTYKQWKLTAWGPATVKPCQAMVDGNSSTRCESSWNGYNQLTRVDDRTMYITDISFKWLTGAYALGVDFIKPDNTTIRIFSTPLNSSGTYTKANMPNFVPGWYKGVRIWGTTDGYIYEVSFTTLLSPIRAKVQDGDTYFMYDESGEWINRQMVPIGKVLVSGTDVFPINTPRFGVSCDTFNSFFFRTDI